LSTWLGYVQWYVRPVYRTAVGEQRSVTLADGSIVVLNTHSELRVHLTPAERRIALIRGEAQFHVAKNPRRPFWVDTSDAAVRAVGTVFNVRDDPAGTQVVVLEGQVEMSAASIMSSAGSAHPDVVGDGHYSSPTATPVSVSLQAGQRAAVTSHGIQRDSGPTVEAAAGWTQRRLVFRDEPLVMVVAEFNRYRDRPLVVADPELAGLRISGVFDAGDPESLVSYLKSFERVDVDQLADGSRHLLRQGERKSSIK
jgi:transmembrane sensor